MRRLPPQQVEKNLSDLIDLVNSTILQYVCLSEISSIFKCYLMLISDNENCSIKHSDILDWRCTLR